MTDFLLGICQIISTDFAARI